VNSISSEYDVIVIGGGPAGSTVAALVAEAGHSTLLVEREKFPRPHVGESLMPETYWTFQRLGVLEKLLASPFVRKVGVQFVTDKGRESQPFLFRTHDPRDCSETWHVRRDQFDQLLFENAAEKGADCRDGVRVLDVTMDDERASGVVLSAGSGQRAVGSEESGPSHKIGAKVVVDATGQQGLISNKLGIRQVNPRLRKAAIWGHFRGAERDTSAGGVTTIILHTESKQAWFWYIPLADDVVSVGLVGDRDYLLRDRGTPEEIFAQELENCPAVAERLANSEPAKKLLVDKEFSYSTDRAAGDGWVLVGDAWGFIDPIYSSGVYFALKSGELAADAILAGLRTGDTSAAQLGSWADDFQAGTNWVRKLVSAYYSNEFRVGKFVTEYPQHRGNLTDLLIGRIFQPEVGAIFDDLDPWLERMTEGEQV
jgi:flavin-dependent dehydrogenase